jgi:signal transduction histidine kinase
MDAEWITSPSAQRVLRYDGDPRPAWLWSGDGQMLIWSNQAATLFGAKVKKHGIKRAPAATPIKGQVSRTLRLGTVGRSSLARVQFLLGEKPASATCATTPLLWQDGQNALLIVGVDPIDAELLQAGGSVSETAPPPPAQVSEEPSVVENAPPTEAGVPDNAAPLGSEPVAEPASERLTRLFDRLVDDQALYAPLSAADDMPAAPGSSPDEPPLQYTVSANNEPVIIMNGPPTGAEPQSPPREDSILDATPPPSDPETVERVSRYNFDELSRILNERVSDQPRPPAPTGGASQGLLVNLGGETLVLNRLPLGILVFRDGNILFANRAITEMVGYESVESLRKAGLAAVFPAAGPEGQEAGPVNHLVQRDGTLVPVTARLQSISWQGKPALMLSASATEVRTGHEAAVRAFAQGLAELSGEGFFETTRTGVISAITPQAAQLLAPAERSLEGKPLAVLVGNEDAARLGDFFERPARFAEAARPALTAHTSDRKCVLTVFAQGQAGVINGYFGLVRRIEPAEPRQIGQSAADPALLARISRGVRRPLNTILGFSDLIASQALSQERYEEYARDISAAGQDIAALVDELDDYARLSEGRYLAQRASVDLTALLESCVIRIRQQANGARVIVRNAISEQLPKVTADRASLEQAVLNLMSSAIAQTSSGGAVIISAHRRDDGGIAIHVRDSSTNPVDMAERFVVFRDGTGKNGQAIGPVRSSVGLALTRSLLAVNAVTLSVDPAGEQGMLFSLVIPPELVEPVRGSAG